MKNIIMCLCLTACLSGCNIYRSFTTPELSVADELFDESVVPSTSGSSLAELSWRELFTDPFLQELITQGVTNNVDLKSALLKVEQAQAVLTQSKLAYLPSLSVNPQLSASGTDVSDMFKELNVNTTLSWELGALGSITNTRRGSAASLVASEAYSQAVTSQLIATIATNYYSLLMLDKQLAITEATAQSWRESLVVMQALMKAGETTQMAVAQYEARSFHATLQ